MSPSEDDDVLSRATRALRETGAPPAEDVHRTRERVLETMRASRENERRSRAFFLTRVAFPIAAVLVGTTAWAAGTGRLTRALLEVKGAFVSEPAPPAPPVAQTAPPNPGGPVAAKEPEAPLPPSPPSPPTTSEPLDPAPAPSAKIAASAKPVTKPVASSAPEVQPNPAPPVHEAAGEDAGSVDLALYKKAHRLHFVDKSYPAALVAWDEYLKGSPGGAFVVEARYNRAICLIKVGRTAEAKAALEPFAQGSVAGGYRKDDARALIDALP